MTLSAIPRAFGRGYLAFAKVLASNKQKPNWGDHIAASFVVLLLLWFCMILSFAAWEGYQFNHLSPAEHLAKARESCGLSPHCDDAQTAIKNLGAIESTAAVFPEASKLLSQLNEQVAEDEESRVSAGRQQMLRNFKGEAADSFRCGQSSKDSQNIVSFDDGKTWWKDDGRCAVRLQRKRDEDAMPSSYWSATVRVDTDMNSAWLPDEERVCQTYPGLNGKVSTVRCSATGEGANHNIPVEFWGGVDRNTVSDWKCRREKGLLDDRFVCRAID